MPYRLPADRIILNPPAFRNVFSTCRAFSILASPRCGAPAAPHTAFSEAFSEALPKRFPNGTKGRHLPCVPSKKGCRRIIVSNPKVNANCFNLKWYLGRSSWHFGHRVRTLGAPAAISRKGFVLLVFQLPC